MSEQKVQIQLRRSSCFRNDETFTHNLLGISMEEHTKQIQAILTDWYMKMVNHDLPEVLLKHGLIDKKEDYRAEEHAKYIEEVLNINLDKMEVFINDYIFGRKEIIAAAKKIQKKKKKMQELSHTIAQQTLELIEQRRLLAQERAERKYRSELAAINLKQKQSEQSEEEIKKSKELDNRSKALMAELKILNEKEKNMFAEFLQRK